MPKLRKLIEAAGFNPEYYTATDNSYNQPYDVYNPESKHPNAQIELMQKDGSLVELSKASLLVRTITGKDVGDSRFFFLKKCFKLTLMLNYLNQNTIIFKDTLITIRL